MSSLSTGASADGPAGNRVRTAVTAAVVVASFLLVLFSANLLPGVERTLPNVVRFLALAGVTAAAATLLWLEVLFRWVLA